MGLCVDSWPTFSSPDWWGYFCSLRYYHHTIRSMSHYPSFKDMSWKSGTRCVLTLLSLTVLGLPLCQYTHLSLLQSYLKHGKKVTVGLFWQAFVVYWCLYHFSTNSSYLFIPLTIWHGPLYSLLLWFCDDTNNDGVRINNISYKEWWNMISQLLFTVTTWERVCRPSHNVTNKHTSC